ncbi:MAG: hypothetical protein ACOH2H_20095 [Cypionkella sp.]
MQDDVQVQDAPKTRGKGKGKSDISVPPGPESQVARLIIRALWQQEWAAANPGGKPAERTAAWKLARQARFEAELKKIRRALMSLKRDGVAMTITPKVGTAVEETESDASDE